MNSSGQSVDGLSGQLYAPDWQPPYPPTLVPPTPPSPAGRWTYWYVSAQLYSYEAFAGNGSLRTPPFVPGTMPPVGFRFWEGSKLQTEVSSYTFSCTFIIPRFPPATYRLLADHYLPGGFAEAGTVITEGDRYIPSGWIPTLAVDPQNAGAIQNFWNLGPRGMYDAEQSRDFYPLYWMYRANQPVSAPSVYWVQVSPGVYQLTGAGASLGVWGRGSV